MRLLRLYLALAGAGLRSQLQYRTNSIMMIITGLVWQGTGFVFIWIVLNQFGELAGWTLGDLAFLYGFRLIVHAFSMLIFNLSPEIEVTVRSGEFDKFLTRPLPVLLQVMTYRFSFPAFGDLLGGILVFITANTLVTIDYSPFALVYLFLAIIGCCFIETSVKLVACSFVFRTLSAAYLVSFVDDAMSLAGNYPLSIYGPTVKALFTFIIPIAFLSYFPATVLLHRTSELGISPWFAILSPVIGIPLFTLASLFFNQELKSYQSVGH